MLPDLGSGMNTIGGNMNTNPIWGFLRTLFLFFTFRVRFLKRDVNRMIIMEDFN